MSTSRVLDKLRAKGSRALARRALPRAASTLLAPTDPYEDWMRANELTPVRVADLLRSLAKIDRRQFEIAVIVPLYRPQMQHLEQAIGSVLGQLYSDFQLCLFDDGSNDPALTFYLAQLEKGDRRVKVGARTENLGISSATNEAVAISSAPILLFLDQDDLLSPDCLARFALAFASDRKPAMVYSDNDKVDEQGRRRDPSFKPDWSPVFLLSHMYMSHALAVTRDLFERVGGFRSAFDGSQDFDFALRAAADGPDVVHLPHILYHWRLTPGSTAVSGRAKPASFDAGRRAVAEAASRLGLGVQATQPQWASDKGVGVFELAFADAEEEVTIIVPLERRSIDAAEIVERIRNAAAKAQIVMVSPSARGIDEGALSQAGRDDDDVEVVWIRSSATTLGGMIAAGIAAARFPTVILLPSDAQPVEPRWLSTLMGHLALPSVGAVAPKVIGRAGVVFGAGMVSPSAGFGWEPALAGWSVSPSGCLYRVHVPHEVASLNAAGMATSKSFLTELAPGLAGAEDWTSLGVAISEAVIDAGMSLLCCANISMRMERSLITRVDRAPVPDDRFYNRNLAHGVGQYRPARVSAPLTAPASLKVGYVTHELDVGGASKTLVDAIIGLKEHFGVEAVVYSPRDGYFADRLKAAGVQIVAIDGLSRKSNEAAFVRWRGRFADQLVEDGIDLLFVNTVEMFAAVNAAEEAGLASLWWQHEPGPWYRWVRRYRRAMRAQLHLAYALAYRVLYVARATHRQFEPLIARANAGLLEYGVDERDLETSWTRNSARAALGISDDEICVVTVGNLCERKGQIDCIQAARALSGNSPRKYRFVIVGAKVEQGYGDRIEGQATAVNRETHNNVTLVGEQHDTNLFYKAADIYLMTSRHESSPRVLREACGHGLPIVTTPVDGVTEIVDSDAARFYQPGEIARLVEHLEEISSCERLRCEMGDRARARFTSIQTLQSSLRIMYDFILQAAALKRVRSQADLPDGTTNWSER